MDFISSRRTKSKLHQFVLAEEKPEPIGTKIQIKDRLWRILISLTFKQHPSIHNYITKQRNRPSVVSKLLSKLLEFDIFHVFKRETGTEFLTVSLIPLTILSFCSLPSFLLCHRQSNCNNTTTKIIPLGTIHQMISLFTSWKQKDVKRTPVLSYITKRLKSTWNKTLKNAEVEDINK